MVAVSKSLGLTFKIEPLPTEGSGRSGEEEEEEDEEEEDEKKEGISS